MWSGDHLLRFFPSEDGLREFRRYSLLAADGFYDIRDDGSHGHLQREDSPPDNAGTDDRTVGQVFARGLAARRRARVSPRALLGSLLRNARWLAACAMPVGDLPFHTERICTFDVCCRRDADEQLVLAHVWNKLANVVQILTIHIFKDDWLRRQTHTFMQSQTGNPVTNNNPSTYNGFVVVT